MSHLYPRDLAPAALPERIGVVVPARDEAAGLPACLRALTSAAAHVDVTVEVWVVLDRCRDGSAAVVAAAMEGNDLPVHRVEIDAGSVGVARRTGMGRALAQLGTEGTWLATTDADSRVPVHWLARQLDHAGRGAAVIAGRIRVADWSGRPRTVRSLAERAYERAGRRHVHGANLSFLATSYVRADGFAIVDHDEDVELVQAMARRGERVVYADDLTVVTSARRRSRAPRGFADYLNSLEPVEELSFPTGAGS